MGIYSMGTTAGQMIGPFLGITCIEIQEVILLNILYFLKIRWCVNSYFRVEVCIHIYSCLKLRMLQY